MMYFYFVLVCSGRDHEFFYNSSNFYEMKTIGGPIWSLPKTNPFFFATLFFFFNTIVLNPVCYAVIYRLNHIPKFQIGGGGGD